MTKRCKNCGKIYYGTLCVSCGWRENPKVEGSAPERTKKYYETVYGQKVERVKATGRPR